MTFLKRLIFKLVICGERYHYFYSGEINAREINLECCQAAIKDITADINPHKLKDDGKPEGDRADYDIMNDE